MQSHAFPASAASSLVSGYCSDFIQLAATMAQTLEQVSMRNLDLGESRAELARVEQGMRDLADAIAALLARTEAPKPIALQPPPPPAPLPPALPTTDEAADESIDDPRGGAREECVMHGSCHSMPLTSVFQFLGRTHKTGTLCLQLGDEQIAFAFEDGSVAGTSSTKPPNNERLSSILVERGFVSPELLEALTPAAGSSARQLGDALVKSRRVTPGQLLEVLEMQVHRRFYRALSSGKDATYAFYSGQPRCSHRMLRIKTFEILFASRQRSRADG
jgi:hypothetical protein